MPHIANVCLEKVIDDGQSLSDEDKRRPSFGNLSVEISKSPEVAPFPHPKFFLDNGEQKAV